MRKIKRVDKNQLKVMAQYKLIPHRKTQSQYTECSQENDKETITKTGRKATLRYTETASLFGVGNLYPCRTDRLRIN